jgi:hypothetical protein
LNHGSENEDTDWKRVDALQDSDIDFSDTPKLGPDFFANARFWPVLKDKEGPLDVLKPESKLGEKPRKKAN